jgi:putative effector of murein hydrolase LrgA (UPF0299 family)
MPSSPSTSAAALSTRTGRTTLAICLVVGLIAGYAFGHVITGAVVGVVAAIVLLALRARWHDER